MSVPGPSLAGLRRCNIYRPGEEVGIIEIFKTIEIAPLLEIRPPEYFAEAGVIVGIVRKAETTYRLPLGLIKRGLFFAQPQFAHRAFLTIPGRFGVVRHACPASFRRYNLTLLRLYVLALFRQVELRQM